MENTNKENINKKPVGCLGFLVIVLIAIAALIGINAWLRANYVYGFILSICLGCLWGGLASIVVAGITYVVTESTKITIFMVIVTLVISCCLNFFFANGDYVRLAKASYDLECEHCSKPAVYSSQRIKRDGYCEDHKSELLKYMELLHSKHSGTSSGGGGGGGGSSYDGHCPWCGRKQSGNNFCSSCANNAFGDGGWYN